MTIGGWVLLIFLGASILGLGIAVATNVNTKGKAICAIVIALVLVAALAVGLFWYFGNTASGQRALTDQKSELAGGLDRVVTIYTANGDVIAQYSGKIDIEANDGGYVKFDYEGNRYIYYNCFVESIAKIN